MKFDDVKHMSPIERWSIAERVNLPADIVVALAADADADVRQRIANRSTP